jgi:N-methylhydantoinase A/oxoprolinase/acetone carboxylase beta subunit
VPLDADAPDVLAHLYQGFLTAHDRVYGHHTDGPARIVNLRSVHRLRGGATAGGHALRRVGTAAPGMRRIRIRQSGDWVDAAIWQRDSLPADARIRGPAIIEQADTTTLVEPGWTLRPLAGGALRIGMEGAV